MYDEKSHLALTENVVKTHFNQINEILKDHIIPLPTTPQQTQPSRRFSFREKIGSIQKFWADITIKHWQQFSYGETVSLIGGGFSFLIALLFAYMSRLYVNSQAKKNTPILDLAFSWWPILTLIFLLLFSTFCLSFIALNIIRHQRSSNTLKRNNFDKVKSKAALNWATVIKLSEFSQESLQAIEKEIRLEIKEEESRDKVLSNLLPFIAIGFVLLFIFCFKIPLQSSGNNWLYGTITGISGVIALVTSLVKFVLDSGKQAYITPLERCLALLEQAQAVKKEAKS